MQYAIASFPLGSYANCVYILNLSYRHIRVSELFVCDIPCVHVHVP